MERETGFEPATNSLEGYDSTTELLPLSIQNLNYLYFLKPAQLHAGLWRGQDSNLRRPEGRRVYSPLPLTTRPPLPTLLLLPQIHLQQYQRKKRRDRSTFQPTRVLAISWRRESNPQPADYKSAALPLSYASMPLFYSNLPRQETDTNVHNGRLITA